MIQTITYDDTLYQLVPKEPTGEMLEIGWRKLVTVYTHPQPSALPDDVVKDK